MENKIVSKKNSANIKSQSRSNQEKVPTEKYILQAELNVISVDPAVLQKVSPQMVSATNGIGTNGIATNGITTNDIGYKWYRQQKVSATKGIGTYGISTNGITLVKLKFEL